MVDIMLAMSSLNKKTIGAKRERRPLRMTVSIKMDWRHST